MAEMRMSRGLDNADFVAYRGKTGTQKLQSLLMDRAVFPESDDLRESSLPS